MKSSIRIWLATKLYLLSVMVMPKEKRQASTYHSLNVNKVNWK